MKLGMQVGLGPGHIVLDGDPGPGSPSHKGAQPPIFGPYLLWPNGSLDQDATCYEGRPLTRPHCARWGPSSPSLKRGHSPPIFGLCLLWSNGWMDQDSTWYEGRSRPRPHCVTWEPSSPPPKRSTAPNFQPMSVVAKQSPISATVEHLLVLMSDCYKKEHV